MDYSIRIGNGWNKIIKGHVYMKEIMERTLTGNNNHVYSHLGYKLPRRILGEEDAMHVRSECMRSVAFLCLEDRDGTRKPVATAFRVVLQDSEMPSMCWPYFVTARHCIEDIPTNEIWVRINKKTHGFVDFKTKQDDWLVHESADVAILLATLSGDVFEQLDIDAIPIESFVTDRYRYAGPWLPAIAPANPFLEEGGWLLNVGEEIYFVGLFVQETGLQRNLPIARYGTISRMPEEPIKMKRHDTTFEQYAYLVECRSWGGHSGSPAIWVWPGVMGKGQMTLPMGIVQGFMGLVSAHYEIPVAAKTKGDILGEIRTGINAGMGIITPSHYITELLQRNDVIEDRAQRRKEIQKQKDVPTMDNYQDLSESDTGVTRDEFYRILDKVSKPIPHEFGQEQS